MGIGINFNKDDDDMSENDYRIKRYEEDMPSIIYDMSEGLVELHKAKRLLKRCLHYKGISPRLIRDIKSFLKQK